MTPLQAAPGSETLEQIALRVAEETNTETQVGAGMGTWVQEFARRLVATLGAQEPVAEVVQMHGGQGVMTRMLSNAKTPPLGAKLFAAPQLPQREGWLTPERATHIDALCADTPKEPT